MTDAETTAATRDSATPLADVRNEARRVIAATDAAGARARVVGGVAVALHDHVPLPETLVRPYADGLRRQS